MLKLFAWLMLLLSAPTWALTQITAVIDKNPVLTNESFVLEITADDELDRNAIDTSILLKDFVVGQTNISRSTRIVNGTTQRSTTWTTLLMCRIPGNYTIPAFTAQGVSSAPIALQVVKHSDQAHPPRDIFFRNELVNEQLYLNQSGVLETRLYLAVQLERGSLSDPEAEGVSFKQMGEDSDKIEIINGRRYRVIVRRYAVTPTQIGDILLRPPMFSGTIITGQPRGFFDSAKTRPVQVVADDIRLNVMAKPDEASEPFIPAQYITLDEEFTGDTEQVTVGEPITRKIVVNATGVDQSVLPPLAVKYPPSLNIYPDKPEISTSYQGSSVLTQYIHTEAIIATTPGVIELPAVTLDYWDTRYHQMAQASIPARTITVIAGKDSPEPEQLSPIPAPVAAAPSPSSPYLLLLNLGLLALWLVTLFAWWLHVRVIRRQVTQTPAKPKRPKQADPTESSSWQQLQQALTEQSVSATNKALSAWLQHIANCQSVAQLASSPAQQAALNAFQHLQRGAYAAQEVTSEQAQQAFTELAAALATLRVELQQQTESSDPLKLYPN